MFRSENLAFALTRYPGLAKQKQNNYNKFYAVMSKPPPITIIGLGSLLSERSSRLTFPTLANWRLARVEGYRRCFAHPAAIFFERGIADLAAKRICSLSAEPCEGASFVCSVFDVPSDGLMENGAPSMAFREREEEFDLQMVPYTELGEDRTQGRGLCCLRSTDEAYIALWGKELYEKKYIKGANVESIWGYTPDSGLLPCHAYLRHCMLAAEKLGPACRESFLDDTFLIDRTSTIREYLAANPQVMTTMPPPELAERYGG